MQIAYIGIGSNLGDRLAWLQLAVAGLREIAENLTCSPIYQSEAHTLTPDDRYPDFLNAVVEVNTFLGVEDLFNHCQSIERKADRQRVLPYGPRTLDLDLLAVGQTTCKTSRIILPHPRIIERKFVLQPWRDLAPDFFIPNPINATVTEALECCQDQSRLQKIK